MDAGLEGRNVVVTGAGGGLGPSVVEALRAAGAAVHAPTRRDADLADEAAVVRYYASLPPLWASIHVAGGFSMAPVAGTSLAAFTAQWQVNAVTAFLASREAVKRMRAGGAGGRIVNVGSASAASHAPGMIAYVAAKGALAAMTQALAAETRAEGILVNAVLPGLIDTAANRAGMPGADFSKWTAPATIAATIAWLASPGNASATGALIPV